MLVHFKDYNLSIKDIPVLKDINLEIPRNSRLGISGPSGSGKSTLVWSLLGSFPKDAFSSGSILFNDRQVVTELLAPDYDISKGIIGRKISIIPQNPFTSLNPSRTCGDQIDEAIWDRTEGKKSRKNLIISTLEQFEFADSEQVYNAYPHQLSGGELQRVVIAMAVINKPKLVIADEPATALDPVTTNEMMRAIKSWSLKNESALIIVSHDNHILSKMCDSVVYIENGRIVPKQIANQETVSNNSLNTNFRNTPRIEVKNLRKSFKVKGKKDEVIAVNHISIRVNSAEILGIVGASGSGKSTLAKLLVGLEIPDSGQMKFHDCDINYNTHPELRKEIQMIFQDPYSALYPHISVGKSIEEPLILHHGLKGQELKSAALQLLVDVGLDTGYYDQLPTRLSGGERQRVQIARALSVDPTVLICDECITGLDQNVQQKILQLLLNLKNERQLSIVFISHDLHAVKSIADEVAVMSDGKIIEFGSKMNIMTSPKHEITRKLLVQSFLIDE